MNIRILGAHNCEARDTKCVCLLIDDILAIDAGGLTSNLHIVEQQEIKAILLTHQHYDHIRDVPGLALNLYQRGASINLYSTTEVQTAIESHLLNGKIYPKFQELPKAKPTVRFNLIGPYETRQIEGYQILALPVNHNGMTISYQVSDIKGKSVFYTADTGGGLTHCWEYTSPQLLIIDVTVPNGCHEFAMNTGHLTPNLLAVELIAFRKLKGYLPPVVVVHMDPALEEQIKEEVARVADALKTSITLAREGLQFQV